VAKVSNLKTEPKKRRWGSRLKWPAVVVGVLLVGVYVILPLIATPIIRDRLQKMISTQLNAELRMESVHYVFPYGVRVRDAVLVGKDESGQGVELLRIPKLRLALAKLPFGEGPLVIRKLELERPSVRLIDTAAGIVGSKTLVKKEGVGELVMAGSAPGGGGDEKTKQWAKLSEMFELKKFVIEEGQVIYEDRQEAQTVPAVWRGININLDTTPAANPLYQFEFRAANEPLAELRVSGTFNVDELELVAEKITSRFKLERGNKESPLPSRLQTFLARHEVGGDFEVSGKLFAPLRRMEEAGFDVNVVLKEGSARIGRWQGEKDEDQSTLDRIVGKFRLASEPLTEEQRLLATAALGATQPAAQTKLKKVGAMYMVAEGAEIAMGDSVLSVKSAALAYDRGLGEWQVKDARGILRLGKQKEELPGPLRAATEKPQFFGDVELVMEGRGSLKELEEEGAKRWFQINLVALCPQLTMTPRKLVWNDVVVNMRITPGLVQFVGDEQGRPGIGANLYGGKMMGHGAIQTGSPTRYDFAGAIVNADLRSFARDWTKSEEKLSRLNGRAFVTLEIGGASGHEGKTGLDLLTASGTAEILDGEFYELPILEEIAAVVTMNKDGGKVGQAAAKLSMANRVIEFKRVAVAAPILGVHGEGKADFEGRIDFRAVAAPLADWKQQLQRTKIPLLDSVGAELVGGVQKILDKTSGKLLYQLRIGGMAKKPAVTVEPTPILTEDGARLLKEMLKGGGRLLDKL
jgi:hypothetical protein